MGDERRLRDLREEEARLRRMEHTDDVGLKLDTLRQDIRLAQEELDATIADARERARRLEGDKGDDQSSP